MNKSELVAALAQKAELSKKDAEKALSAFVDVVTETLKAGDKVQLVGFGTFEAKERPARSAFQGRQSPEGQPQLIRFSFQPCLRARLSLFQF